VKAGKSDYKTARGTSPWVFTARRLKTGKNIVLARAVDSAGNLSNTARVKVIRR
jgi:hypothetical protein